MQRLPQKFIVLALWCGASLASTACASKHTDSGDNLLEVEDPDPETDPGGPQFCNPTGKSGDVLAKCHAQNVSLSQEFDDEAKKREPWFDFPPDGWSKSPELDGKFVIPVQKDKEATTKLALQSFVPLSATDVEFFTGKTPSFAGRTPFLVRGLLYFKETGAFKVFTKDQAILVQHDSLGLEVPQETRSAVVVFLAAAPVHIYVQCGVLE